jgi:DNA-directed RNA polymerase subunit RPC12/RpoP
LKRARGSVVGVRAGARRGTGFAAMKNGLIVTSLRVIGYGPRAFVRAAEGEEVEAKVVFADTRRDLAFLMAEPLQLPPLPMGDSAAARPGDAVFIVGQAADHAFTVAQGILAATEREVRGLPHFQIDAAPETGARGGPVLDRDGRVLAVCLAGRPERGAPCLAVPAHVFADLLPPFFGPAAEVTKSQPSYRCLECEAVYGPEQDRCRRCGARVPYLGRPASSPGRARAERVAAVVVRALGFVPNQVRAGPGEWRLPQGSDEVRVRLDESGEQIALSLPLAGVPREGHERFFRFLLAVNDRTSGPMRVALEENAVVLEATTPVALVVREEAAPLLQGLVELAAELRGVLREAYGAPAPPGE